jgi:hypothetical protein
MRDYCEILIYFLQGDHGAGRDLAHAAKDPEIAIVGAAHTGIAM